MLNGVGLKNRQEMRAILRIKVLTKLYKMNS